MAGTIRNNPWALQVFCALFLAVIVCMVPARPAHGKVYATLEDALREAFPGAEKIEKHQAFLSAEDVKRVEAPAKGDQSARLFVYYTAMDKGKIMGYAHFASHVVRTKKAVTMMVFEPGLTVRQVRVVAFYEPEEYLPAPRWFGLFKGKALNDGLRPGRDIQAISGATLSVQRITQEVRSVMAVFQVVTAKK